jgi:pantoate--beta-alanine ligase
MNVWKTIPDWMERRRTLEGRQIGLVPTMGALHRGHLSLIERGRLDCEVLVVSIFVNPTQFNDPKDLERYPRTLEDDLRLLEQAGAHEVILPGASEMYPRESGVRVEPNGSSQTMEGAYRPGFFAGVATVVLKLLNLVRPHRAYFGEKDYQQWKVIDEMASDLFVPTEIIACPTVREESGLAASSRNRLLSPEARRVAPSLFRAISTARSCPEAKAMLERQGFAVDYVEEHWDRRFAAAFLDGVRLIDNVPIPSAEPRAIV